MLIIGGDVFFSLHHHFSSLPHGGLGHGKAHGLPMANPLLFDPDVPSYCYLARQAPVVLSLSRQLQVWPRQPSAKAVSLTQKAYPNPHAGILDR